jgi:DegV family protein with EDD domain
MEVTNYMDGKSLYYGFVYGAKEVIRNKRLLNKINVFPVQDGDTGSNLASTLDYIVNKSSVYDSALQTFQSIADAALTGARGNSGAIFAQYLNGITMELFGEDKISLRAFSISVKNAVPYAYKAISNPVEGTMLTIIKDWSEAMYSYSEKAKDFLELFSKAQEVALISLNSTTEKMVLLKENSVVDAGAKGFIHFLEGFINFLKNGQASYIEEAIAEELEEEDFDFTHTEFHQGDIKFRYCTEALLQGKDLPLETLKTVLTPLGDSLIVAGDKNKAKIHLHTDKPQDMFLKLREYGTILEQKADDMKAQNQVITNRKYPIALVTDSIADIPKELIEKYQIHVLPLNILLEGSNYLDRISINAEKFFSIEEELKEFPTSSQPSARTVENLFSFLTSYYDSVIAVIVSKELSGTFNAVNSATEKLINEGKKLSVINSKLNSGAEGLLVLKAAEEIASGKSHDNIVHVLNNQVSKTKIYVSVDTLKYMVRSGRVSQTKGSLAKLLNLKPIVSLDEKGAGTIFDKAFSRKGSTKKLISAVKAVLEKDQIDRYVIVHGNSPKRAQEYKEIFTRLIGKEPEYIEEVSTIVAMSAGEGSVAIAFSTK